MGASAATESMVCIFSTRAVDDVGVKMSKRIPQAAKRAACVVKWFRSVGEMVNWMGLSRRREAIVERWPSFDW